VYRNFDEPTSARSGGRSRAREVVKERSREDG
jgi:hypothetical protein